MRPVARNGRGTLVLDDGPSYTYSALILAILAL